MRSITNDPASVKGKAIEQAGRFAKVRAAHVWQFRTIDEIAAREKAKEEQAVGLTVSSVNSMK